MAENLVQHNKSKHVEIDRHFLREKIEDKIINVEHVSSSNQVVDIITKPVTTQMFQRLIAKISCINIYTKLD